jgi:hypothetical protein
LEDRRAAAGIHPDARDRTHLDVLVLVLVLTTVLMWCLGDEATWKTLADPPQAGQQWGTVRQSRFGGAEMGSGNASGRVIRAY